MKSYAFKPIGCIHSCFKEKFGAPRQPGLVPGAEAVLEIYPPYQQADAFRQLEAFSHVWILFLFHQCEGRAWRPTVRPPRLGGNQRVGVFASRSGYRPNPIGQSAVELVRIEKYKSSVHLHLRGVDMVDGTPVLDIKPYLVYADSLPHAKAGYAHEGPPPQLEVLFTGHAERSCLALEKSEQRQLKALIADLLALDPRPGYANTDPKRRYGMRLWDINITFRVKGHHCQIENVERIDEMEPSTTKPFQ